VCSLTEIACGSLNVVAPKVVEQSSNEAPKQPARLFETDAEDELGARLRRRDLERVADNVRVREALGSQDVREVVRAIDEAADGKKALELAREDPKFRAFTELLLDAFDD